MIIFWTTVLISFLLAELFNPGLFYFLAISIGSWCAIIANIMNLDESIQCLIFLISSVGACIFLQCVVKKMLKQKSSKSYVSNTSLLIGKTVEITSLVSDYSGYGKVGGEIWVVKSKNDIPLQVGAKGIVIAISGCHLEVDLSSYLKI